ncbi:ABC-type branched-chain amino acid transport system [Pararhodospirillum photometricum DSM 122]|uniref:ABC-type branched-chain amino acid transport system n=1 Tax=Pararhodospirillum photometricum DSM 122 TaxID=1150469 RepID=H6SKH6_PARPM|nr:ABC-type branched-chain amino acid transport system [Pararhodospirillum photometricum DSM 122]
MRAWFDALSPQVRILGILLLLMAVAPLFFPSAYYYRIATQVFLNGLTVTGLVVLMGYAGQVSLGHAGFFGLGAYACAVGSASLGIGPLGGIVLGAGVSGTLALVVGRPILRLKGHYLAVATLGLGILIGMVLTNEGWLTGGPDGMTAPTLPLRAWFKAWGLPLTPAQGWYIFGRSRVAAGSVGGAEPARERYRARLASLARQRGGGPGDGDRCGARQGPGLCLVGRVCLGGRLAHRLVQRLRQPGHGGLYALH